MDTIYRNVSTNENLSALLTSKFLVKNHLKTIERGHHH
jgi:hypothetical protein